MCEAHKWLGASVGASLNPTWTQAITYKTTQVLERVLLKTQTDIL